MHMHFWCYFFSWTNLANYIQVTGGMYIYTNFGINQDKHGNKNETNVLVFPQYPYGCNKAK